MPAKPSILEYLAENARRTPDRIAIHYRDRKISFRELEERLNRESPNDDDDPFQAAASSLSDADARKLIETILLLYGRLMELVRAS